MIKKRELIYPVFLECCEHIKDNFWKYIFEDLAYGKTPMGTYFNKNFLCCNYKGKEFSYNIDKKKDTKITYNEIYDLLKNKINLFSKEDQFKKKNNLKTFCEEKKKDDNYDNWSSIKKKNVRNTIIENYVVNVKKKHNLTIIKAKILLSIIFTSLVFKTISSTDIVFENGKIQEIKGIYIDKDNEISVSSNIDILSVKFPPDVTIDKKTMSDYWDKYITNLQKFEEVIT
jgi:hypothetical protein